MARLFIPGPTDVLPEVLQAQARPLVGHRSQAFQDLFNGLQARLQAILKSSERVFISTSSGSGLHEAAMRNCVSRRVLVCVCGNFGERWHRVAVSNGLDADRLDSQWGQPIRPEQVEEALRAGTYEALAIVHNETSTGVENPIAEIAAVARAAQPDLLILVDAVSSAAGVNIEFDAWGLDVLLTASQKCFALPPGLAFAAVSDRAMQKARQVPHRGWYFDFLLLEEALAKGGTPATPPVSLLFALDAQLSIIEQEGLQARFDRHARMAAMTQEWGSQHFQVFAEQGYRSKTVTALLNHNEVDLAALRAFLGLHEISIARGMGPWAGKMLRIGHMGQIQPEDLQQLFDLIDQYLKKAA